MAEAALKVTGLETAERKLKLLVNYPTGLEKALKVAAADLSTYAIKRIRAQADSRDTPFKPLAESTLERKKRKDQLILVDEGRMMWAMIGRVVNRGLEFGNNMHYLHYHQFGTKKADGTEKMPRRAVFPLNEAGRLETEGSGGKFWTDFRKRLIDLGVMQ